MNIALFDFTFSVGCPECELEIDLLNDSDDESIFINHLSGNDLDKMIGAEICCPRCDYEFKIDKVER